MPREEFLKAAKGKDALMILPDDAIDEELVKAAGDQLKVVSTHSVGYYIYYCIIKCCVCVMQLVLFSHRVEHIDQGLMERNGIKVGHTPGVLTADVADLSVALTLMTMRRTKENMA